MSARVFPVNLATYRGCDYSHNVYDTRFGEKVDAAMLGFVIVDGPNTVVFDTGPRLEDSAKEVTEGAVGDPVAQFQAKFEEIGKSFEDVTHVVLSHLHWDHLGNIMLFPNAKIYIQRREMANAAAPEFGMYYHPSDIAGLIGGYHQRIQYLDGDSPITEHTRAVALGGHTPGSQGLLVETTQGRVALAGDVCCVYENLETHSPTIIDVVAWVRAIKRLKAEAEIILPGHEIRVVTDYPTLG